jgi:hypothetical protein
MLKMNNPYNNLSHDKRSMKYKRNVTRVNVIKHAPESLTGRKHLGNTNVDKTAILPC